MLLRSVLSKQGYRVVEADNGAHAVDAFGLHAPDLVLMDVMMPVMNGFEACSRMREHERVPGTPIIMLTGAEDLTAIEHAFDSGATDFITKPINWPLLTARLRYALRTRETSLELQRARLRQLNAERIARLGFFLWHLDDDRLEWSGELMAEQGITPAQLARLDTLLTATHPEDRERLANAFAVARASLSRLDIEMRLCPAQADAPPRVIHLICEHVLAPGGKDRFEGAYQDLTEVRETEFLVQHMALHDELTGLPNRKLFLRQAEAMIASARSRGQGLAVVLFDIHRLARINDALGIRHGDLLLGVLAQKLRHTLPPQAEVARVDGDEFAVLLPVGDVAKATAYADAALAALSQATLIDGQTVFVSVSAGIARFPEHGINPEWLLAAAQDAQKRARASGSLSLTADSGAQTGAASESLRMEFALRSALEQDFDQFFLVYQPQLELRTQRVVGVEALVRWRHPEHGLVAPPQFIPLLEEMGLITVLGEWIIREACRQARDWLDKGLDVLMGINLSARQFQDESIARVLTAAVTDAGIAPRQIKLEITESLAMQDPQSAIAQLQAWREQGFRIAIDDFGIGYSSLEYLLRFPIDTIKIDRAFVQHITDAPSDRAIVRAITVMAQSMGLSTIAEGVETQRQRDYLDALGVHEIQGYLVSKPIAGDELYRFACSD